MPGRRDIAVKQSIPKHLRYTVNHFNAEFPNDDACLAHIAAERYPGGMAPCEKCKKETKHHRINGRTAYSCDYCGTHIYPLAGTIFEKTTTSLRLWFYAMYLMGSTRCGISAKQIQREIGVTYKTAWRMFKQIRTLMSEDLQLEGPTVEMDETYYGGVRKYGQGRPMRGDRGKTPIVGIVERKGRAVARATQDATGATLLPLVRDYILPESTVYTDEWKAYGGIENIRKADGTKAGLVHRRINHKAHVYVHGDIHTNSVEGFWSLIKRGIGGVYHSVSSKYLQTYLDEYSFRYNRRDQGNLIFKSILEQVSTRAVD
ncbi:MAG: IS1595 family transposase [Bryobacteraceae bacterium]|jgi:transposase-like protein